MPILELPKSYWALIFVAVIYAPAILRLLFFFVHDGFWGLRHLNRWAGCLELYLGWVRDILVIPLALALFGFRIRFFFESGGIFWWPWEILGLALALYSRRWRWHGLRPLFEFARLNPKVHPSEFFGHLYALLGFCPHRVPKVAKKNIDPLHVNFRKNRKPKQSFFIILKSAYTLFFFPTLAFKVFRWRVSRSKEVASGLSLIWASRMMQIAQMEVFVEKPSAWDALANAKKIFAISHKSFFDFCLAPYVYMKLNADGSASGFMPRIMVAKDHFKDNIFLYKFIGIGRMLEAWGMIFVDRKSKEPGKAKRAVSEAVKKILSGDMTFSIYPQGTRAWGQRARDGFRWDAGYFCVGKEKRLKQEGGHLKKGVAYIAVETALSLLKHNLSGPVWVVPIGMDGVGTACPKKSLQVQTETKVFVRIGEPIVVEPKELRELKSLSYQEACESPLYRKRVENVLHCVDVALQSLLEVATRLERRFFVDLREILDPRGVDEVAVALKQWRHDGGYVVYVILDFIYALPPKKWRGFLTELANLLRHECTRDDLMTLRTKIAECFSI